MGYKTFPQKTFLNVCSFWASCFALVLVRKETSVSENIVRCACAVFTIIRFSDSGNLEETYKAKIKLSKYVHTLARLRQVFLLNNILTGALIALFSLISGRISPL